jgi:hypothetical protein
MSGNLPQSQPSLYCQKQGIPAAEKTIGKK